MNEAIIRDLLVALNIVVMEQVNDGFLKIIGAIPDWFMHLYSDIAFDPDNVRIEQKFPFLENFLIDAEDFWQGNDLVTLKSGIWSEINDLGNEYHLEASAVRLQSRKMLIISLLENAYEEKQFLIQTGRENSLNCYHLSQEIQKKEILLHCIVHDLAGQLTGIKYCFELLALQNITPKGRDYLNIGQKQVNKQEILMREMLSVFAAEVESLEAFAVNLDQAPSILECIEEIIATFLPSFAMKKLNLQLAPDIDRLQNWQVIGEKSRLDRVIHNLIENALRYSPANSSVTIGLQEQEEFIVVTVDDEGSGVEEEISKTLFEKFSQGKCKSGRGGLGLYFCRITVERWGGMIGYTQRDTGGSRFWFRLPKPPVN